MFVSKINCRYKYIITQCSWCEGRVWTEQNRVSLSSCEQDSKLFVPSKQDPKDQRPPSSSQKMFDPSSKSFNTHLIFPRAFDDHPDSGVCSPPLWRTSPPKSPQANHQNLSPVSKAQVIARGQRELMEMVSKMPESCYELSLKDLVEVKTEEEEKDPKMFDEMPQRRKMQSKVVRKSKSDRGVDPVRNRGVNNSGFLLNLGFPVSLGAKKKTKKKDEDDGSVTSRGSPRPSISEDKDWWKSESSRSQREVSRINSGGSKSSAGSSSRSNSYRSRSNRDRSRSSLRYIHKLCGKLKVLFLIYFWS